MTEPGLPTYLTRQFALTKPQLASELGAELLSLCQTVTADGRLAPEEIAGLQQWLRDAEAAELQAARFLRGVIERVLADGRITAEEYQEVYRAVEAVLPFEARQQAHAARERAESSDLSARAQAAAAQTTVARAAQAESAASVDVTFMVAGVRQDGRPALIEQHASAGMAVTLELAAAGTHRDEAIAVKLPDGTQIGFVPAAETRQIAALLQQGARCSAHIVRIRSSGRSPIPVVQVRFFPAEVATIDPLALAASQPPAAASRWGRRLALLVGIAVAALIVLVLGTALAAAQADTPPNLPSRRLNPPFSIISMPPAPSATSSPVVRSPMAAAVLRRGRPGSTRSAITWTRRGRVSSPASSMPLTGTPSQPCADR